MAVPDTLFRKSKSACLGVGNGLGFKVDEKSTSFEKRLPSFLKRISRVVLTFC